MTSLAISSDYKIIFSGPVGAGKTTAINSISDIPTIKTEAYATDKTNNIKATTTVALDYGSIILKDGTRIHLYGTPGQKRFGFMWDILMNGGVGMLLLIDGSNRDALRDLRFFIKKFEKFIDETAVVVGITKHDQHKCYALSDYRNSLKNNSSVVPVFEIDARKKSDVALMIETLLYILDPKLSH